MARVKVPRKSTHIDMTAMCDVAFLLLTFFILSAKPRPQDPIQVDTPASSVEVAIPDENVLLLTVGQGKIFYTIDAAIRKETLTRMGEKYNVAFSPEEQQKFANTNIFGVPFAQLKGFLALEPTERKAFKQPGMPYDTTANNELADWIREARKVNAAVNNKTLLISIKGDNKEEYPTMRKLIALLQKQEVNKFSLITSLRAAPKTK
jgi:biopolymer transport protein ExbD